MPMAPLNLDTACSHSNGNLQSLSPMQYSAFLGESKVRMLPTLMLFSILNPPS